MPPVQQCRRSRNTPPRTAVAPDRAARGQRLRVTQLVGRGRTFTDDEADAILDSPAGMQIKYMSHYTAVGTADEVRAYLDDFVVRASADELIIASMAHQTEATLRSFELLAKVSDLAG